MMKTVKIKLNLNDGYELEHKTKVLDQAAATEILHSRRQRYYTSAKMHDNGVVFEKDAVLCPYCGRETPDYTSLTKNAVSRREAEEWLNMHQLSFFGDEEQETLLNLNSPKNDWELFICNHCGATSTAKQYTYNIEITYGRKVVSICCMKSMSDLMKHPELSGKTVVPPVYEKFTFNFRNGHTFVELSDSTDQKYLIRDITESKDIDKYVIPELIGSYPLLRRKLVAVFEEVTGSRPFTSTEVNLQRLIEMTRFIGFPSGFYRGIPYTIETGRIDDPAFRRMAKKLHRADKVIEVLNTSSLPKAKTIRRKLFSSPALLFYIKELEIIWKLISDVNIFRRFLSDVRLKYLIKVMIGLHDYPSTECFYRDYISRTNVKCLIKLINHMKEYLNVFALQYASMRDEIKQREKAKWAKANMFISNPYWETYSVPETVFSEEMIRDYNINGFTFSFLRSTCLFYEAGAELGNCLTEYRPQRSAVYVIKSGGKAMAAVEVKDGEVLQAYGYENEPVKNNPFLFMALKAWIKKTGLEINQNCSLYDEFYNDD